jgi:hypothetical protein
MKTVYRVIAYAIAVMVAVQAAAIGYAVLFGVAVMAAMRVRKPAVVTETVPEPVA